MPVRARPLEIVPAALAVLAGSAIAAGASFLIRLLAARALGPSGLGLVTIALAIATAAGSAAALGLNTAAAHTLALLRARAQWAQAHSLARTILTVAAVAGTTIALALVAASSSIAALLGKPALRAPLLASAPLVAALAVGTALVGISRAFDDVAGRAWVRDTLGGCLRLLAVGAALALGAGAEGVVAAFAAALVASEGCFALYGWRRGWLRRAPVAQPESHWILSRALLPYSAMAVTMQIAQWWDVFLLGALAPAAVVGVYGVARGVERSLELVSETAAHRFLPDATAALSTRGPAALASGYDQARGFVFCLLCPAAAVCIAAPEPLLLLVFGAPYTPAAAALRILCAGLLFSALAGYNDKAVVASGGTITVTAVLVAALGAGGAVACALIPRYGPAGAAAGWAAALLVQNLALSAELWRRHRLAPWSRALTAVALRGALPPALLWALAAASGASDRILLASVAAAALLGAALAYHHHNPPAHRGAARHGDRPLRGQT